MSQTNTADPYGAQAHARSQAGTRAEAMPTVPASRAQDLPPGVSAADMLWEETIAPGGYAARRLNRGARLRLVDLQGDACASMLIFNAERPIERLNVADTLKVQWNAYLGEGRLVLSDMGKVMFSILEDTAATHDAFCGASNAASNARRYGTGATGGRTPMRASASSWRWPSSAWGGATSTRASTGSRASGSRTTGPPPCRPVRSRPAATSPCAPRWT
jgi:uncharacterized protein YcgI (DUF1989 family)